MSRNRGALLIGAAIVALAASQAQAAVITGLFNTGTDANNVALVGGTSIMGLMMLSAATGTEIVVEAKGKQAGEAMDAIVALVTSGFGEED